MDSMKTTQVPRTWSARKAHTRRQTLTATLTSTRANLPVLARTSWDNSAQNRRLGTSLDRFVGAAKPRSWVRFPPSPQCDVSRHRRHITSGRLPLIVARRIQRELPQQLAVLRDDAHVLGPQRTARSVCRGGVRQDRCGAAAIRLPGAARHYSALRVIHGVTTDGPRRPYWTNCL